MSDSTPSEIVLRDATAADVEAIVRLLIQTKQGSLADLTDAHDLDFEFWRERWLRYIEEGSTAQQSRGDGSVIAACADGAIVAFAAFHHTRRWNCDAELESIYVHPDYQNRGLGTMLLSHILDRLRADGSRSVCVGYDPRNGFKRFYMKHGAEEIDPHWAIWRS